MFAKNEERKSNGWTIATTKRLTFHFVLCNTLNIRYIIVYSQYNFGIFQTCWNIQRRVGTRYYFFFTLHVHAVLKCRELYAYNRG